MSSSNVVVPKVDVRAEDFVTRLLTTLFTDVAALSPSVIKTNVELSCETGFSKVDRSIKAETANYLLKNFGVIYLGLISNDVFRDSFKDAVAVEISLDDKSDEFVRSVRDDMRDGDETDSKGNFVLDFGHYKPQVAEKIGNMIGDSLAKISDYESEFNELVNELTEDEFIEIGFCISNFAYLIRAFDKNPVFMHYVKDVISIVRKELNIK